MTEENSPGTAELLERASTGDRNAMNELFQQHRDRLKRVVRLRLNAKLRGRIDVSDIVQEICLEAAQQLQDYVKNKDVSFFLWLRRIAGRRLIDVHRRHLGAAMRDARREISLSSGEGFPPVSSASLAAKLLGKCDSPPSALIKTELRIQLQDVLNGMDLVDREILVLRHFEQLSNAEAAEVLGLSPSGASSRYVRALQRLTAILSSFPGFKEP